jgi:hypothetical protein
VTGAAPDIPPANTYVVRPIGIRIVRGRARRVGANGTSLYSSTSSPNSSETSSARLLVIGGVIGGLDARRTLELGAVRIEFMTQRALIYIRQGLTAASRT